MRFLGIVLIVMIVGGCAKKTETQQKKEMSKEPVVLRAQQEAAEPAAALEGPYLAVVSFDFGKSRAELSAVDDEIRKASPADYPQIEAKLIAVASARGMSDTPTMTVALASRGRSARPACSQGRSQRSSVGQPRGDVIVRITGRAKA